MKIVKDSRTEYKNIREWEKKNKSFYDRNDGVASTPHTICIYVNNNCFMKCKMCDIGCSNSSEDTSVNDNLFSFKYKRSDTYKEFPIVRLKRLIDEFKNTGIIIKANFVEPLIYRNIRELAEYTQQCKLPFYLVTNGWLLKKNAHWLVNVGTNLIRVSLDGLQNTHDEIRGIKGSFNRTIEGLWALIEYKKKLNLKKPLLGICYTISNYNFNELLVFMEYLKASKLFEHVYLNINHLQFTTEWEVAATRKEATYFQYFKKSSISEINLDAIDIEKLGYTLKSMEKHFNPDKYHYYFTPNLTCEDLPDYYSHKAHMYPNTPCYLPWLTSQVEIDGEVGVYGHCLLPSFGNIMEKPFMDIWNSEKARLYRKELKDIKSYTGCNRCIGTLYPLRGRD